MTNYSVSMSVDAAVILSVSVGSGFVDLTYDDGTSGPPSRLYDGDPLLSAGYPSVGDALVTFTGGVRQFVPAAIFSASFTSSDDAL